MECQEKKRKVGETVGMDKIPEWRNYATKVTTDKDWKYKT